MVTKNDIAWEKLIKEGNYLKEIEKQGYFYVKSHDLNKYRQSRLMAKLDTSAERPKIFKDNKLTIFPVENGKYIVFKDPSEFSYFSLEKALIGLPIEKYNSKVNFNFYDTYPQDKILNESQVLDFGLLSSLFTKFMGENDLNLTIRGRIYSDRFNFELPHLSYKINVNSVQMEIDSGYEAENNIYIVEAKVSKREDFHIRQLFYPYMHWKKKSSKNVVPIFLIYTNGKFYLLQFKFGKKFGDLKILKRKCYTLNEEPRPVIKLSKMLQMKLKKVEPTSVPYPQANDLDKVVDLVTTLSEGIKRREEIAEYFEFDERQADYYAAAGRYLGLVERKGTKTFTLTYQGKQFANLKTRKHRIEMLAQILVSRKSFNELFYALLNRNGTLNSLEENEIVRTILRNTQISERTARRRASTVKAWIAWLIENSEIK